MDFALTRKKLRCTQIIAVLICILLCCSLNGCDPAVGRYPYDVSTGWVCADPYVSLYYITDEQGNFTANEVLEWDGRTIPVYIGYRANGFFVYPDDSTSGDDVLFWGEWKYQKGNLIFTIEEDHLFNHEISKLVFEPVNAVTPG